MCTLGGCGHAADLAKFLVKIKQSGKKTIFLFLRERKNEKILKDQLLVLKSDQKNYYFVWKERERDSNNQILKNGSVTRRYMAGVEHTWCDKESSRFGGHKDDRKGKVAYGNVGSQFKGASERCRIDETNDGQSRTGHISSTQPECV